jgi:hypothetical protein
MQHAERRRSTEASLFVGRAQVRSVITLETDVVTFAVLHFGSHNLTGGIRRFRGDSDFQALASALVGAFEQADEKRVVQLLASFPEYTFSLRSLFSDPQREVLDRLLETPIAEAEAAYRAVYQHDASLIRFLLDLEMTVPPAFRLAAEYVINAELRRAFSLAELDLDRARALLDEANDLRIELDMPGLAFALGQTLEHLALRFRADPDDLDTLQRLADLAAAVTTLPFDVDLWRVQNVYYAVAQSVHRDRLDRGRRGEPDAGRWLELFTTVGERLAVALE